MTEPGAGAGQMLLTVFLKHRQSMNLAEINQKLDQTGFWRKFPPEGVGHLGIKMTFPDTLTIPMCLQQRASLGREGQPAFTI